MKDTTLQKSVWIIILNWNGWQDTIECLESVFRIYYSNYHVIVWDNGSRDNSVEHIGAWAEGRQTVSIHELPALQELTHPPVPKPLDYREFTHSGCGEQSPEIDPQLLLIRSHHNYGFASANNFAVEYALNHDADYVLLLNNDAVVARDALNRLVDFAEAQTKPTVVAPLICYYSQPDRVWFAGATAVLSLGYFQHRRISHHRDTVPRHAIRSDYVTGCCMLIPSEVIRMAGLFDDDFFAYFEDADFSFRVRRYGIQSVCLPSSVIWHKESASTRKELDAGGTSPLKHYLTTRNRIVTIYKHGSTAEIAFFLLFSNTFRSCFYLAAFTIKRRWEKLVWFFRGVVHGVLRRLDPLL